MIDRVLLYVEEEDGTVEATIMDYVKYLQWQYHEFEKQYKEATGMRYDKIMPEPLAMSIQKIDFPQYEDLYVNEEPLSRPLVPLKQHGAYSHKPKGVKRVFKTQQR